MAIITEKLNKEIVKTWEAWREWRSDKKEIVGFPSFFPPRYGEFKISPRTKPTTSRKGSRNPKGWENYDAYITTLTKKLLSIKSSKGYEGIDLSCFLYVTFKKCGGGDIDNLFKRFSDVIGGPPQKKGVFLNDDSQIICVDANVIRVLNIEDEGISFRLVPTYELEIRSVKYIKTEEDLKKLYELRQQYVKLLEKDGSLNPKTQKWSWTSRNWQKGTNIFPPWKYPMQMVETNYGIFFDNYQKDLLGTGYYGNEPEYYEPQNGFNWKSKEGEEVDGIVIFERSGCWWINKRAE